MGEHVSDPDVVRARAFAVSQSLDESEGHAVDVLAAARLAADSLILAAEVERLRAEVAARLNADDYDPAPIILEYDRMAAERDAYRAVVDRMRNLAAQLSVGWDLEMSPDPLYVAQGQAFKEAARRILAEIAVDALSERGTRDP